MVILPRYCKEISRYAAVPDCWVRYLARKVLLQVCYGAAVTSLGVEEGIANSCLRGGYVYAEEEGRLCFPLVHLHSVKISRQTRVKRLGAYIAIVGTVIGK